MIRIKILIVVKVVIYSWTLKGPTICFTCASLSMSHMQTWLHMWCGLMACDFSHWIACESLNISQVEIFTWWEKKVVYREQVKLYFSEVMACKSQANNGVWKVMVCNIVACMANSSWGGVCVLRWGVSLDSFFQLMPTSPIYIIIFSYNSNSNHITWSVTWHVCHVKNDMFRV